MDYSLLIGIHNTLQPTNSSFRFRSDGQSAYTSFTEMDVKKKNNNVVDTIKEESNNNNNNDDDILGEGNDVTFVRHDSNLSEATNKNTNK